jgi:surfactin synthase thioesterase subunit/aryl carrier-like protein
VAQPCPRLRLLCFPHGGGSASVFRDWQSLIGEEVEVWAVQLPGREGRRHEKPHRSLTRAVAELVGSLGRHLDQPFALFGHSVGADLGYALALELRRRNLRGPEHLIVAAQVPPHDRVIDDPLHLLEDAELLARLEGYGGIPDELLAEREALELALPRLRADLQMSETFAVTPADRLDVPVTAFGGLHDRTLHGPDIERWAELTTNRFQVEWWQGDHFFVHADAEEVVAQVHALLTAHAPPQPGPAPPVPDVTRIPLTPPREPGGEFQREPSGEFQGESGDSATGQDVAAAMAEVAPELSIEPDENFFDAGLGSLALLRLQAALQARGHQLEITDLFRWPTIRRLVAGLDEQRGG